jgi:hypothetical protein
MKCPVCDASTTKSARFCSQCGASVTETTSEQPIPDAASDDLRAARAFAEDAAQRHAVVPKDDLGTSMAKGAAIGALVSIPVPFVGLIGGAMVGAGVAAYKKLTEG